MECDFLSISCHALVLHYENKTNKCIWYVNLLHCNCFKPPTCFGQLLRPSSGRCFYEGYITKTTNLMYKYKILIIWFTIYVKVYNTDKIICAKFTWVRSVRVLHVARHHSSAASRHNTITLLGWWYDTHSTWTFLSNINLAQII